MKSFCFVLLVIACVAVIAWSQGHEPRALSAPPASQGADVTPITKTDAEWGKILTAAQYDVLRQKGTERPFTGEYWNNHEDGEYVCAACGLSLFNSSTKFESGTGWPSFFQPLAESHVRVARDDSLGMERDEVVCARCGGHLGHVFNDGPQPTGLRYCMNSVSLKFIKQPATQATTGPASH